MGNSWRFESEEKPSRKKLELPSAPEPAKEILVGRKLLVDLCLMAEAPKPGGPCIMCGVQVDEHTEHLVFCPVGKFLHLVRFNTPFTRPDHPTKKKK